MQIAVDKTGTTLSKVGVTRTTITITNTDHRCTRTTSTRCSAPSSDGVDDMNPFITPTTATTLAEPLAGDSCDHCNTDDSRVVPTPAEHGDSRL